MAKTAERRPALRAAALAGAALIAVVAGGCGTDDAKVAGAQVYGTYLSVYSSLPLSGPNAEAGNDILNGERLAFSERNGKIGDFILNFVSLNSLAGKGKDPGNGQVALNARRAVTDPRSIAYIGDFEKSQTELSRVIVDQAQLLQVAPSAGWDGLPGGKEEAPGFRTAYRKQFGEPPTDDALYGYEAMNDVLDAIERAGKEGGNRIAVAEAFRAGPGN